MLAAQSIAIYLLKCQRNLEEIKPLEFAPAVSTGEREIILGPELVRDTTMQISYEKEIPPTFTSGSVIGGSLIQNSRGFVRWSVLDATLFEKPCRILKYDGITKMVHQGKTKREEFLTQNTVTYWVSVDGKILRQSNRLIDPLTTRKAESVFFSDHIEASVEDEKGRRSFTLFPKVEMKLFDQQFQPMVNANKFLINYKDYCVFDPFKQATLQYKASASGNFKGTFLATKFEGLHVDLTGPDGRRVAYISKEGDLVYVERPNGESLVLNMLPASKDPAYSHPTGGNEK